MTNSRGVIIHDKESILMNEVSLRLIGRCLSVFLNLLIKRSPQYFILHYFFYLTLGFSDLLSDGPDNTTDRCDGNCNGVLSHSEVTGGDLEFGQ